VSRLPRILDQLGILRRTGPLRLDEHGVGLLARLPAVDHLQQQAPLVSEVEEVAIAFPLRSPSSPIGTRALAFG